MAEVGWELSNKKCACAALQAKAGGEGSRTPVRLGHCSRLFSNVFKRDIATCMDLAGLRWTFLLLFLHGQPH